MWHIHANNPGVNVIPSLNYTCKACCGLVAVFKLLVKYLSELIKPFCRDHRIKAIFLSSCVTVITLHLISDSASCGRHISRHPDLGFLPERLLAGLGQLEVMYVSSGPAGS